MHRKRVASRSSNPQPPNERPRFGHWRLDRRMDNQRNCRNRNGDFLIVDSSRRLERDPSEHQHANCEEEAPLKRRNSDYSQVDGFHMPMPDLTSPVEVAIMEDLSNRMERCRAVEHQQTQRSQSSPRLKRIPSALFRVVRELIVSTKRIRIRRRKNNHNNKEQKLRTTTANSQLSFLDVDLSRSSFLNDENRPTKSNRRFQLPPNCEPIETCPIELLYEALIDRSDLPIFPGLYEAASLSYYFGNINRHDAVRILDGQKHGTFLLRDSSHPDYRFAVSFRNNESTVHARIQFNHGRYAFKLDSKRFSSSSLAEFINNYKTTERKTYDEPYLLHAFSRKEPFSLKYLCTTAIVSKCSMPKLPNLNIPDYVKRTIIEQFILVSVYMTIVVEMYIETKRVVCVEEPFVSVHFDLNLDSLITCTYSKDATNRSGQLRILNKETLSDEWKLQLTSAAFHLEYVDDFYVAGLGDGRIVFFDPKTCQIQTDEPQPFAEQMITDAKVSSSNRVAITDESGALRVYERVNSTVIFDVPKAHEVYGQSVNAWSCEFLDSSTIISGGDDDQIKFWDLRVDGNKPTQISRSHSGGVVRIRKFDDTRLFTGSYDETFRCFDVRRFDEPLEQIKLDGGVWDFQVQEDRILIASMYGGWSIVDRQFRLIHHQSMTNSLVYGLTSSRDEPELVYCCSFTDGVLCAMKQNLVE